MTNKQPYAKFKAGPVATAVWENVKKTKEGKEYLDYSINTSFSWKDGEEWKSTNNIPQKHLADAILTLQAAQRKLRLSSD